MDRKDFLMKSGCGVATFMAAPFVANQAFGKQQEPKKRNYQIDIEIFEVSEDCRCHSKGDKYRYPEDMGQICPWLVSSMKDFIIALQHGGVLNWKYANTPYEKVIDPDGVTTEYIRCPDPTKTIVAKITRTLI